MKTINELPGESCCVYYNTYDCVGAEATFYVMLASTIGAYLLVGCGIMLFVYRSRFQLDTSFFRHIKGAYVPVPLTCIVLCGIFINSVRAIQFTLLLLDLPQNWILRGFLGTMLLIAGVFSSQLFTLGVIAHIPPAFMQPTVDSKRPARTLIYLPSPQAIHYVNIMAGGLFSAMALATGLWFGWIREQGRTDLYGIGFQLLPLPYAVAGTLHGLVCVYYSVGFYRFITEYAENSSMRGRTSTQMLDAAKRFRTVFLMVLGAISASLFMSFPIVAIGNLMLENLWLNLIISGVGNMLLLPGFMAGIIYTALKSSMALNQRDHRPYADCETIWDTLASKGIPVSVAGNQDSNATDASTTVNKTSERGSPKEKLRGGKTVGISSTRIYGDTSSLQGDDYGGALAETVADHSIGRSLAILAESDGVCGGENSPGDSEYCSHGIYALTEGLLNTRNSEELLEGEALPLRVFQADNSQPPPSSACYIGDYGTHQ